MASTAYLAGGRLRKAYSPSGPETVGRDRLIGGDVAKGQGDVGDDAARRVLDDAGDGAVDALGQSGHRHQQQQDKE